MVFKPTVEHLEPRRLLAQSVHSIFLTESPTEETGSAHLQPTHHQNQIAIIACDTKASCITHEKSCNQSCSLHENKEEKKSKKNLKKKPNTHTQRYNKLPKKKRKKNMK